MAPAEPIRQIDCPFVRCALVTSSVALVREPERVHLALSPARRRLLAALHEPQSATQVAELVGMTRQQANYHLRVLEAAGLVELVETRQRRGCTERILRAVAGAFVVDPAVMQPAGHGAVAPTATPPSTSWRPPAPSCATSPGCRPRPASAGCSRSRSRPTSGFALARRRRGVHDRARRRRRRRRPPLPRSRRPALPRRRRRPPQPRTRGGTMTDGLRIEVTLPGARRRRLAGVPRPRPDPPVARLGGREPRRRDPHDLRRRHDRRGGRPHAARRRPPLHVRAGRRPDDRAGRARRADRPRGAGLGRLLRRRRRGLAVVPRSSCASPWPTSGATTAAHRPPRRHGARADARRRPRSASTSAADGRALHRRRRRRAPHRHGVVPLRPPARADRRRVGTRACSSWPRRRTAAAWPRRRRCRRTARSTATAAARWTGAWRAAYPG